MSENCLHYQCSGLKVCMYTDEERAARLIRSYDPNPLDQVWNDAIEAAAQYVGDPGGKFVRTLKREVGDGMV